MKPLEKLIYQRMATDTLANNFDNNQSGQASENCLQNLLGPSFKSDKGITKYKGDVDVTNVFPSITYFSKREEGDSLLKHRDSVWILIRDNNQQRLDSIAQRIIDIMTLPFLQCSTFKPFPSDNVMIGLMRLEEDNDAALGPKIFEKSLKFDTKYIDIRR